MSDEIEKKLSNLISLLLKKHIVSDDTLLSKLLTSANEFNLLKKKSSIDLKTLEKLNCITLLDLEQKSASFLIELLGAFSVDETFLSKVIQIYKELLKDEALFESSSLCSWLCGLKSIAQYNHQVVVQPEFTDKITSCLHDKRYFIQKQSCDLLVNLFSKVKEIKTKNEKELILKTIESIEKLVTNGTKSSRDNLSEYEKVMPLTLIQSLIQCELSSSCYKKITEILHQSILKKKLFNESRMIKSLENLHSLNLDKNELKSIIKDLISSYIDNGYFLHLITVAAWTIKMNLNCVDVLWYSNLITQPLQTIIKLHKTVFDVNENNSGHNPELTSNTNKPNEAPCNDFIACNDDSIEIQCPSLTLQLLCLYRVSDSLTASEKPNKQVSNVLLHYMSICLRGSNQQACVEGNDKGDGVKNSFKWLTNESDYVKLLTACLNVVHNNSHTLNSKDYYELLLQTISQNEHRQLLIKTALEVLVTFIINNHQHLHCYDSKRLDATISHVYTTQTWERRDYVLEFVGLIHHHNHPKTLCALLKTTNLNKLLVESLNSAQPTVVATAISSLTHTLHCGCSKSIAQAPAFQTEVQYAVLELLQHHDEALVRRKALNFLLSRTKKRLQHDAPIDIINEDNRHVHSITSFVQLSSNKKKCHVETTKNQESLKQSTELKASTTGDQDEFGKTLRSLEKFFQSSNNLNSMQFILDVLKTDMDWEVKLKTVEFISRVMVPYLHFCLLMISHRCPHVLFPLFQKKGVGIEVTSLYDDINGVLGKNFHLFMDVIINSLFIALNDFEKCVSNKSKSILLHLSTFYQVLIKNIFQSNVTSDKKRVKIYSKHPLEDHLMFIVTLITLFKVDINSKDILTVQKQLLNHEKTLKHKETDLDRAHRNLNEVLDDVLSCVHAPISDILTSDDDDAIPHNLADCY